MPAAKDQIAFLEHRINLLIQRVGVGVVLLDLRRDRRNVTPWRQENQRDRCDGPLSLRARGDLRPGRQGVTESRAV